MSNVSRKLLPENSLMFEGHKLQRKVLPSCASISMYLLLVALVMFVDCF